MGRDLVFLDCGENPRPTLAQKMAKLAQEKRDTRTKHLSENLKRGYPYVTNKIYGMATSTIPVTKCELKDLRRIIHGEVDADELIERLESDGFAIEEEELIDDEGYETGETVLMVKWEKL